MIVIVKKFNICYSWVLFSFTGNVCDWILSFHSHSWCPFSKLAKVCLFCFSLYNFYSKLKRLPSTVKTIYSSLVSHVKLFNSHIFIKRCIVSNPWQDVSKNFHVTQFYGLIHHSGTLHCSKLKPCCIIMTYVYVES